MNERDIFIEAIRTADATDRGIFLDQACANDADLRQRVETLVEAHERAGSFLEPAFPALAATLDTPIEPLIATVPGTVIGSYKLLEQIGEGGMGVVYMAEQAAPVRRKVALKIIKPGMDTREVIARFEAERQALAMMDHQNIARVFDAGATQASRPYFVMELVRGVPITDYCDQNNLPVHERLELFVTVCHAVQHAHQKGIIHRDIKPSNVLVTLHDGRPVPKVIDFGVAKAIGQQLTDTTLFTQFAQMVGTPLYMSPEQAELTGLDIDTRGDIYSLGVMLYELLIGTTPFERGRMKQAALDEIRRMIREEDPPSPSTRLSSTAGETQTAVAAHRRVDPRGLSRLVQGDLDWIVMKALEKDRTRRYGTANGFAADIGRFLNDEPVEARPPSTAYRFRKFARRNRVAFFATSLVAGGLVAAVVLLAVSNALIRDEQAHTRHERSIAVQLQRTAEERAEQLRQGVLDLQAAHRLLERGRILLEEQNWDDADAAFTRAIKLRPEYSGPWEARADLYIRLGLFDLAVHDLNRAYELQEPVNWRWMALAILRLNGDDPRGCHEVSVRMRQQTREAGAREFAVDAARVASLLPAADTDPLEPVALAQSLVDAEPANAFLRYLLGLTHYRAGQFEQAAAELNEALSMSPDWEARRLAYPVLAMTWHRLGRDADARRALADAARAIEVWTGQICQSNNGNWAIHQGVGQWPVRWWDWLECRLFYREARLLIDGSPPPEDPRLHVIRARAFAGLRRTRMALDEYEAAIAGLPDDPQLQFEQWRTRGYFYGYRDWPQAAREFAKARRQMPDQPLIWNFEAIAHLAAGNPQVYRQLCSEMLARFADTQDPRSAQDIVCACVLRPQAVPDPAQLISLARVASGMHHGNRSVIGAACFRAGQYEEAVRQLEEAARLNVPRGWEWSFLAMAHHHLGHTVEAQRCLQSAARWMAEADTSSSVDMRHRRLIWGGFTERFEFPLLYAEAATLIGVTEADAAVRKTRNQSSDFSMTRWQRPAAD
ncbi:MAG: protein kinase [Planctomycetia bacterium]|nr:protein kinase [Planctomycetia bacterium]